MQGRCVVYEMTYLTPQVHRGSLSEVRKHLQQNAYTTVTQQKSSNKIQTSIKQKEEESLVKEQKQEKDGEISSSENGLPQNAESTKNHQQQNGSSENHQIVPPKPLPRASRAGSLETEDVVVAPPKPKPRTTTTACSNPQPTSVIPTVTSVNPATPITGGYKVSITVCMIRRYCRNKNNLILVMWSKQGSSDQNIVLCTIYAHQ